MHSTVVVMHLGMTPGRTDPHQRLQARLGFSRSVHGSRSRGGGTGPRCLSDSVAEQKQSTQGKGVEEELRGGNKPPGGWCKGGTGGTEAIPVDET